MKRHLEPLDFRADPIIGFPPHPVGPCRDRVDDRTRAAETLTQSIGSQVGPCLIIPELAFVGRVSDTSTAEVTAHSLEKPRYPSLAMWTVNPRPITTKVTVAPRKIDELRGDLVA